MPEALAAAAAAVAALAAPHLLTQARLSAPSAIALWVCVLALRAALALSLVVIAVLYLPATELFGLLTHWCIHAVIPFFATHLGFDGHRIGDAAVLVPALVIAASVLSVGFGIWHGARAAHSWLRRHSLGPGPSSSVIVGGSEVVVAAAGLRAPRVVVSAGALVQLDDAELAAGLEHEWGHVTRHHRFIALAGQLLAGLSRLLPGSRRALDHLHFQLERDADEYAVRRTGDRLALASAICKAAGARQGHPTPALASLGGSGVPERIRLLLRKPAGSWRAGNAAARLLSVAAAILTLTLVAATPVLAASGWDQMRQAQSDRVADCE